MLDTLFYRPDELFDQLTGLHQALTRSLAGEGTPNAIRSVAAGSFPGINVGRTPNTVEVYAFAPGLDAKSIDVTIERGVLRISGERRAAAPAADAKVQTFALERPLGRFTRALSLPDDVDSSKVEARYRDGVLQVSIGLQEGSRPQRITVQ